MPTMKRPVEAPQKLKKNTIFTWLIPEYLYEIKKISFLNRQLLSHFSLTILMLARREKAKCPGWLLFLVYFFFWFFLQNPSKKLFIEFGSNKLRRKLHLLFRLCMYMYVCIWICIYTYLYTYILQVGDIMYFFKYCLSKW